MAHTFNHFLIGSIVQFKVNADDTPPPISNAKGRVHARERYTDALCTRCWVCVTWFDENGCPQREPSRHAADELYLFATSDTQEST
jgi:hypothetical protein